MLQTSLTIIVIILVGFSLWGKFTYSPSLKQAFGALFAGMGRAGHALL
jgi:hypothetical protein